MNSEKVVVAFAWVAMVLGGIAFLAGLTQNILLLWLLSDSAVFEAIEAYRRGEGELTFKVWFYQYMTFLMTTLALSGLATIVTSVLLLVQRSVLYLVLAVIFVVLPFAVAIVTWSVTT